MPRCGGRLRVIATVQDSLAVQAILAHRARSPAPPRARPRPTHARRSHVAREPAPEQAGRGARAITMPTLAFALPERALPGPVPRSRGGRTGWDARRSSGHGVNRSYAQRGHVLDEFPEQKLSAACCEARNIGLRVHPYQGKTYGLVTRDGTEHTPSGSAEVFAALFGSFQLGPIPVILR